LSFSDPDGNNWIVQEITARLTGHIAKGDTGFTPELTREVHSDEAAMLHAQGVGGTQAPAEAFAEAGAGPEMSERNAP
jgi:hypothetical protein